MLLYWPKFMAYHDRTVTIKIQYPPPHCEALIQKILTRKSFGKICEKRFFAAAIICICGLLGKYVVLRSCLLLPTSTILLALVRPQRSQYTHRKKRMINNLQINCTLELMLSQAILEKGSLSYSTDVKPTIDKKNGLNLSCACKHMHMSMLSLCVYYNRNGMNTKQFVLHFQTLEIFLCNPFPLPPQWL